MIKQKQRLNDDDIYGKLGHNDDVEPGLELGECRANQTMCILFLSKPYLMTLK